MGWEGGTSKGAVRSSAPQRFAGGEDPSEGVWLGGTGVPGEVSPF